MFCRGVAKGKTGETMFGLIKITSNVLSFVNEIFSYFVYIFLMLVLAQYDKEANFESNILLLLILILDIFLAQILGKKDIIDATPVIGSPLLLVSVCVLGGRGLIMPTT